MSSSYSTLYELKDDTGGLYDVKETSDNYHADHVASIYSLNDVIPDQSVVKPGGDKPVLEDLPLPSTAETSEQIAIDKDKFEELWNRSENLIKQLQEHVKDMFDGMDLKAKNVQQVLEKLILQTRTRKKGSPLVTRFLKASRENDFPAVSEIFDTFVNQAEKFARVIICERGESQSALLIPLADIGGVAGGKKFIAR
jgi:hypothetical protein